MYIYNGAYTFNKVYFVGDFWGVKLSTYHKEPLSKAP